MGAFEDRDRRCRLHDVRAAAHLPGARFFDIDAFSDDRATLPHMLDNLRTGRELVLDARSAERFHARTPEPRPGIRGGHIPGSVCVPFAELLNHDGTLRSPEQLRARFFAAGVSADRPVVTSCGSGVSAALLALGLEVAGLGPAAVYDGSWAEWGGRADTPVATVGQ